MFFQLIKYLRIFLNFIIKTILIISVFFVVITAFFYFINKDQSQTVTSMDPIKAYRKEIYKNINNPEYRKDKNKKIALELYRTSLCFFIGEGCTDNPDDGDKNFNNSLFGFLNNLIILPYSNPLASGVYWAYSGLISSGFIPKTYAAEGIGFAAIKPFINIWKAFRNIAYMVLVLVLISIGFMIMFRMKLNPQTVITVENSLPKIVISLILITFSFPIVGFLIDLMYVVMALIIYILGSQGFFNITEFQNQYLNAGFGTIWDGVFGNNFIKYVYSLAVAIINIIPYSLGQILKLISSIVFAVFMDKFIFERVFNKPVSEIISSFKTPGTDTITLPVSIFTIIGGIILFGLFAAGGYFIGFNIIIFLLTIGTFIITIFRIFFMLISSYIKIFLLIIISPLFLMLEALPGSSSFSKWIKMIIAELISFPAVATILIICYIIITKIVPYGEYIWQPPFLFGIDPKAFTVLVGFALLFMIPDLTKSLKAALGLKESPFNLGLGMFFAGSGAAVGGIIGTAQKVPSVTSLLPERLRTTLRGKVPLGEILIPPSAKELHAETGKTAGEAVSKVIQAQTEKLEKLIEESKKPPQ